MNKIAIFFILCSLGYFPQANSTTLVPVSSSADISGISFTYSIRNKDEKLSNTFLSNETVNFQFNINIGNNDVGRSGELYLVAHHQENWYLYTPSGEWRIWDNQTVTLQPFKNKVLEQNEIIQVVDNMTLPAGEFLVYAGYRAERDKRLFYSSSPAPLIVFNKDAASLHQIKSKPILAGFFARGSLNDSFLGGQDQILFSGPDFSTPSPAAAESATTSVSQTNLQEIGVDEADRIKTDGEQLYTLESCEADQKKQCIAAYSIQANPAANTQLDQLDINADVTQSGSLYLAKVNNKKHLIHLNNFNSFTYGIFTSWYWPSYWQNNKIDINFVDITQPENMQINTRISMDTALISSRLVDGVLYLVTRKNPYFDLPQPLNPQPVVENNTETGLENNPIAPESQDVNDLLPAISFNDDTSGNPVVGATDCYIPSQNSIKRVDNTLITITAIPLDNPKQHYSTCVAGNVDTFYMSTKALYLASSRYPSTFSGIGIIYDPGDFEMETEIHKFSIAEGKLDYRGSGTAAGHLGWDTDKQPFRMGEHDDILKVATSKGNSWDDTSTSSVTVLREVAEKHSLETIGVLDNLGKPGERIYAARFIGARGYLVTFKQVDPLYVLDFSQPDQPKALGELEINGYSEYLHPIGEKYLLGIGKDAKAQPGEDFSWYQGVKLSLFDVSDGENPREIKSIVLGKRGTESAVLYDHHALAWLASGDSATLAIPVQLNDQESSDNFQDYSQPNAFYDWTHTGLYTFNINTGSNPGIELEGKLITDTSPEICNAPGNYCSFAGQQTYNDRAVIQGESVHYIHNNAVYSSALADLN